MARISRAGNGRENDTARRVRRSDVPAASGRRAFDYEEERRAAQGYSRHSGSRSYDMPPVRRTGASHNYNNAARTEQTRPTTHHSAPQGRRLSARGAQAQKLRRKKSRRIILIQLILSILLVLQVWRTQMLPEWMLAALGLLLLLAWSITIAMQKYPRRGAATRFFAWVLSAVMAVGCIFTQQGIMALQTITSGQSGSVVGVYVRVDDAAKTLADTADYSFGCLAEMDRTNTDQAIAQFGEKAPAAASAAGYENAFALADALYNGEVNAIILNQSFLGMYADETSGYTDFESRTRCIATCRIASDSLQGDVSGAEAQQITQQPFLVYLSGVDTRGSLMDTCRSDVNILAAVNPVTHRVVLINTPRDYYVPLAGTDGASDKLTHAGLYGVDCSMKTLGDLYGAEIAYYVKINFAGFIGIVDDLGGIDVISDYAFTSVGSPGYYDPTSFVEGMNHMDGAAALAFARERHAFATGDIQRGQNQMKVIAAIIQKMESPAVLRNYSGLMNHISDSFVTGFSYDQITALVKMQLKDGGDWTVERYSAVGTSGKSTACYSAMGSNLYIMKPDATSIETAKGMIASVLNGEPAPEDAAPAA